MSNPSSEPIRLPEDSIVYRFIRKQWVDFEGNVLAEAFQRLAIHPKTKREEAYISLGIASSESREQFKGRMEQKAKSFKGGGVGELVVGGIGNIPNSDLFVERDPHDEKHGQLYGVPLRDTEGDEGYLIARALADLTNLVIRPEDH